MFLIKNVLIIFRR